MVCAEPDQCRDPAGLLQEIARLRTEVQCDACLGVADSVKGICGCGGTGRLSDMLTTVRRRLADAYQEVERLRDHLVKARTAMESIEPLFVLAMRCGRKLWTAYQRNEVSPRNEYDEWIVAVYGTVGPCTDVTQEGPAYPAYKALRAVLDELECGPCEWAKREAKVQVLVEAAELILEPYTLFAEEKLRAALDALKEKP